MNSSPLPFLFPDIVMVTIAANSFIKVDRHQGRQRRYMIC